VGRVGRARFPHHTKTKFIKMKNQQTNTKKRINKGKSLFRNYRTEAVSTTIVILTTIITFLDFGLNFLPTEYALTGISLVILFLLLIIVINIKRFFRENLKELTENLRHEKQRFISAENYIYNLLGIPQEENIYHIREQHFAKEKGKLSKEFVYSLLPEILSRTKNDFPEVDNYQINLFLDSGTTITPIFDNLISISEKDISEEILPLYRRIKIYTNNIAGLAIVQRIKVSKYLLFKDRDFHSVGGQLLNPYKALTGEDSEEFIKKFGKSDKNKYINISVVTSNWFLSDIKNGKIEKIKICSRGPGHLKFKKLLTDISDYLVIMAPLGKILGISKVSELENLLPEGHHYYQDDKYESFPLPEKSRNQNYFLSSFRTENTLSPLRQLSFRLQSTLQSNSSKNFIIWKNSPSFNPYEPFRDKKIAEEVDLPHKYIKDNFSIAYGFPEN
jgi:hypothetical protein